MPSESRWFALKDHKLRSLYKGQLLLQFDLVYNPVSSNVVGGLLFFSLFFTLVRSKLSLNDGVVSSDL